MTRLGHWETAELWGEFSRGWPPNPGRASSPVMGCQSPAGLSPVTVWHLGGCDLLQLVLAVGTAAGSPAMAVPVPVSCPPAHGWPAGSLSLVIGSW